MLFAPLPPLPHPFCSHRTYFQQSQSVMMGFPVISGQLTGYNEGIGYSKSSCNPCMLLARRNVNLPVPLALFRPSDLSSQVCVKSDA